MKWKKIAWSTLSKFVLHKIKITSWDEILDDHLPYTFKSTFLFPTIFNRRHQKINRKGCEILILLIQFRVNIWATPGINWLGFFQLKRKNRFLTKNSFEKQWSQSSKNGQAVWQQKFVHNFRYFLWWYISLLVSHWAKKMKTTS